MNTLFRSSPKHSYRVCRWRIAIIIICECFMGFPTRRCWMWSIEPSVDSPDTSTTTMKLILVHSHLSILNIMLLIHRKCQQSPLTTMLVKSTTAISKKTVCKCECHTCCIINNDVLFLREVWVRVLNGVNNSVISTYIAYLGAMMLNATFNDVSVILCQSLLLVEETRVPGNNHWPPASHWQILFHNVVSSTPR